MFKTLAGAALAVAILAGPASAKCDDDFDALSKAISGPVTMDSGHRAAMMRMALSGYDSCMAGDPKNLAGVSDMLMKQLRENLGGK
jgi:hypothetical protein